MDSDDLEYNNNDRIPNDGPPSKPFQLNFPVASTPRNGRPGQRKSQPPPPLFALSGRNGKPPGSVFAMTPKADRPPRFSMSALQSPPKGDFYPPDGNKENTAFKIFPQPNKSNPFSTPARHAPPRMQDQHRPERFESHSRQHSTTQSDAPPEEGNLDDVIKKLKEAALIKSQLAEERMINMNLRSELTTSQNSILALQQRISVLEAENDRQANNIKTSSEDILQLQTRLHQATAEKERNNEIAQDKDSEVSRLRTELQATQDKLHESEARVTRVKDVSRKGMESLSRNYDDLKNNFNQLKLRFDASQDSLQRTKDDFEIFKGSSEHHLKIVESHLDENGRYLHKSAETRALVAELQQDRHSAQQVIDIMRDKLQNMGAQLIESKQRVADLELRQLEDTARWTRRSDNLQELENKVAELAEKLVKRETESFDILLESANLSSSRRDAEEKLNNLQTTFDEQERTLKALQKRYADMESAKVKESEDKLREVSSKLLAAENKGHRQDSQIASLHERLQGLTDRNTSLAETTEQSRRTISKLELEVQEAKLACAAETTKWNQSQDKLAVVEAENVKLKKELLSSHNQLRDENARYNILQERFDSQTMTLKLAKEQSGDLQERLLRSETSYATKLEAASGAARAEVSILEEQKSGLERLLQERNALVATLEEAAATHRVDLGRYEERAVIHAEETAAAERNLKARTAEWESRLSEQKIQFDKCLKDQKAVFDSALKNLQDQKASLDKAVKGLQSEAKAHASELTKLKVEAARQEERLKIEANKVDVAKKETAEARVLARDNERLLEATMAELDSLKAQAHAASEDAAKGEDALSVVNAKLEQMQDEVQKLRERERTIGVRYQAGDLTDIEKTFVQSLIQMTQGMYEQDVVNKENELRSRDNIISALQSKMHSLESTLAKCLKRQVAESGQGKATMVDLNLWMSSPLTTLSPSEGGQAITPSKVTKVAGEEDDIEDVSDDDKPLCDDPIVPTTTLGKRERPPSPTTGGRPARRTKASVPKKTVTPTERKADNSTKAKPKKRR